MVILHSYVSLPEGNLGILAMIRKAINRPVELLRNQVLVGAHLRGQLYIGYHNILCLIGGLELGT